MKKIILTLVIVLALSIVSNAQNGLNIGGSIGFPINSSSYDFTFGYTLDANILFELHPGFSLGIASGYGQGFGDTYRVLGVEFDVEDYQYVPVALAGRHYVNNKLVWGTDVGYAIAVSDVDRGGFYFRPMIGFNVTNKLQLNANYVGISDRFYWSTLNLGITLNISKN